MLNLLFFDDLLLLDLLLLDLLLDSNDLLFDDLLLRESPNLLLCDTLFDDLLLEDLLDLLLFVFLLLEEDLLFRDLLSDDSLLELEDTLSEDLLLLLRSDDDVVLLLDVEDDVLLLDVEDLLSSNLLCNDSLSRDLFSSDLLFDEFSEMLSRIGDALSSLSCNRRRKRFLLAISEGTTTTDIKLMMRHCNNSDAFIMIKCTLLLFDNVDKDGRWG